MVAGSSTVPPGLSDPAIPRTPAERWSRLLTNVTECTQRRWEASTAMQAEELLPGMPRKPVKEASTNKDTGNPLNMLHTRTVEGHLTRQALAAFPVSIY